MLFLRFVRRFSNATNSIDVVPRFASSTDKDFSFRSSVQKPDNIDEPALVRLKKERDPEKLFHLFKANAHNKVVIENRFVFEDVVSRLAGAGRLDYIENLLEHQKTLPQGRREGFIVRIIMLYGRAGMTKQAVNTFHDMHLYGCKRTVKSFNAALKVLAQSRNLEAIESLLSEVPPKTGIKLDIFSVNIVIKAFCDMGILKKAFLVMVEMERLGIVPDVITYTTLIAACYKENRPEIANGLWNLMVSKNCLPNVATFNARIQFLASKANKANKANKGFAWKANKLLAFMRHHKKFPGFPDEVSYNLVMKGFCRAGYYEMAMRVYSALQNDGYKPNQKIYQTMVHYLCESGEFDLAYSMCKDSLQKNWFPNVDTIINLLEGLRKGGKLDKAKYIYSLAVKRVPPFSASQIGTIKSTIYGKCNGSQNSEVQ